MKSAWIILVTVFFIFAWGYAAQAARPIVYSARYYFPPGSKRKSLFHIYLIRPDGSGRRQLTFGSQDDFAPTWSPNGRWILFKRGYKKLCVVQPNRGSVRTVATGDDMMAADAVWWPARNLVFLPASSSSSDAQLIDVRNGHVVVKLKGAEQCEPSPGGKFAWIRYENRTEIDEIRGTEFVPIKVNNNAYLGAWVSPRRLVTYTETRSDDKPDVVTIYDLRISGISVRENVCPKMLSNLPVIDQIQAIPGRSNEILVAGMNGHRNYDYYLLNLVSNSVESWLLMRSFVAFSPKDGRYVTARVDLIPYGRDRVVWGGALELGTNSRNPYPAILADGLVEIAGADWRR